MESWAWSQDHDEDPKFRLLRALLTVIRGSLRDRLWLRSGNMTYLSLLHLVPVGALALSLSRHAGWQDTLVAWIQSRLSPTAPELAARLVGAMDRLDVVTIGLAGFVAVILSSILALSELEGDLGEIWETPHQRRWRRRIWMYPLAIVLAPTLLAAILIIGAIAEARTTAYVDRIALWGPLAEGLHQWLTRLPILFELLPYVLTWAIFATLYRMATPARIGWGAASVGGLFTGVVWLLAQGLYIGFQLGASTYRELWGYLAQIPLLLVWIYASWAIVFMGAEVVYAWQHRFAYMPKWRAAGLLSFDTVHRATSRVASRVLQSVESSGQPAELAVISGEARIPLPIVMESVAKLEELNLLVREKDGWFPAAELEKTTIGEIGDRLRRLGESSLPVIGKAPLTDDMTIRRVAELESRAADRDSDNR